MFVSGDVIRPLSLLGDQILGCLSNTKAIPLSDGFIKDIKVGVASMMGVVY